MSASAGDVTIADGVNTPFEIGHGQGGVLLSNESGLRVKVVFDGTAQSRILGAGMADFFTCPKGFNGNLIFQPSAKLSNVSSWPSSYIEVETFGPGERPAGTYPVALPRATNNGNVVQTSVTSTNAIDNEGNPAGTSIIKSIVSGDGTNQAVSLTNDAQMTLGDTAHPGLLTIGGGGQIDTDTIQSIADAASVISVSSGKTRLQNSTLISLQVPGGTDRVTLSSSTLQLINSAVFKGLTGDSIARFGNFSGTGSGTVSHSLGATPDFASITVHQASSSATVGYAGETSTQITVTLGASLAYFGFCTKRT